MTHPFYRASQLAAWTGARWTGVADDFAVAGVSNNTRTLRRGEVYLALRGAAKDGHQFVAEAVRAGAVGLITERICPEVVDCPQLVVEDGLKALWQLAAGARASWTGTVIGITGSVGKTTVKEMIAAVLARQGLTSKTPGNYNNEIGLPLSMLQSDPASRFFVFELGMNHPGEIDRLASLLRPDWAVITEIGKAHIEHFGTVEKIAEEKASLLRHAGRCLLDETSEWFRLFQSFCSGEVIPFGTEPFDYVLAQPGEHMIRNARRAAALGAALGLSREQIQEGLSLFTPGAMRWEEVRCAGVVLVNDAYNANPLSMRASLATFAAQPCAGRRWAVLGTMNELGDASAEEHRALGNYVDSLPLDEVITIGTGGAQMGCRGRCGIEKGAATEILRGGLRPGDAVLFKASRGERLETIVNDLVQSLPESAGDEKKSES